MEDRRSQNQRGLYNFESVHAPVLRSSLSDFAFPRQLLKDPRVQPFSSSGRSASSAWPTLDPSFAASFAAFADFLERRRCNRSDIL